MPECRETSGGGKRRKIDPLARKVGTLTLEFAEIKTLLLNLQQTAAVSFGDAPSNTVASSGNPQRGCSLHQGSVRPLLLSSQFPGYGPHHTEGLQRKARCLCPWPCSHAHY